MISIDMKNNKYIDSLPKILVVLIALKAYIPNLLDNAMINMIFSGLLILVAFINVAILLLVDKKINCGYLILLALNLIIFFITGNGELFFGLLVIYGVQKNSYDEYLKIFMLSAIILYVFVVILNILGIKESGPVVSNVLSANRKDLGFTNPNVAFIKFAVIWFSFVYLTFKYDKLNKITNAIMIIFPIIIFLQTFSRTGMIVMIMTYMFAMILKYREHILDNKIIRYLIILLPIIYTILSFIMCSIEGVYNNKSLNVFLSGRPQIWHEIIYNSGYPIKFLGYDNNIIKVFSAKRGIQYALDGSFVSLLFINGILIFVALLLVYIYTIKHYLNKKDYFKILMIISLLTYCFIEPMFLDIAENITLFLIFEPLMKFNFGKFKMKQSNYLFIK